ncbi:type VII secretion target [Mycobacteroides salmoniphilum]|uniref:Uncharacterized protein n=1 Tax=Mycobacteroides salmoniphilum TaxID=404941 RepID=A0A4R8SZY5_9MYCO|nr:type VII secretion target [Mycobacteroides salmoniphilum]TEA09121.1 hypothetical protein CCUG60884_00290 [Mycobacteroides salmoniphilum]
MAKPLRVNPADLELSAGDHDHRAQGWRQVGANPPNDPEVLEPALGFIGYGFSQGLRAHNGQRTQDAHSVASEYAKHAEDLRASAADYRNADDEGAQGVKNRIGSEDDGSGVGPNGVGHISDFQSGGMSGPYDTTLPPSDGQVRAQMPADVPPDAPIAHTPPPVVAQMPPGVGADAPMIPPGTQNSASAAGGVSGPFDVQGSGPAQVRPAGHTTPIDPSPGDYDRLYPKLYPQPLPGQPGGGTWTDVAPSLGDANHPPHGGLIPNFVLPGEYSPSAAGPPGYTQVVPNGQGGYDIVAPGTDPTDSARTDGRR